MAIRLLADTALRSLGAAQSPRVAETLKAFCTAADTWASVGAPPDEFAHEGQDWGTPPFVPHRLRARGYQPFVETVRAGFRHAGGMRIDHVMGLFRLFWVPGGGTARHGAYVRYPTDDLLAITRNALLRVDVLLPQFFLPQHTGIRYT